jgi:hypothetical protein
VGAIGAARAQTGGREDSSLLHFPERVGLPSRGQSSVTLTPGRAPQMRRLSA